MIDGVLATLKQAGLMAALYAERPNISDVIIKGYSLPAETCVEGTADIVLPVPSTFPQAPPYGFFVLTPITRQSGAWRNTSNAAPYQSGLFFSRKCEGWDVARHDIIVVLAFINQWLAQ